MNDEQEHLLLRVEEVARLTGLSRSSIYAYIRDGDLPAIKLGKARRIRRSDLDAWIDSLPTSSKDDR